MSLFLYIKQKSDIAQDVYRQSKKEKGIIKRYIDVWKEKILLDWTDRRKFFWFGGHAIVLLVFCMILVLGSKGYPFQYELLEDGSGWRITKYF